MNLSKINKTLSSFVLIACLIVLGLGIFVLMKISAQRSMAKVPIYGTVPPFSLMERSGRTIHLSDLRGEVWVVDFIFTTCPGPCPVMTGRMKRLQEELAGKQDVRLVSVTVDPETDTPAVLSQYADRFGADHNRWLFLTGSEQAIHSLATDGLHLAVQENVPGSGVPDQGPIVHSTRFVLIDRMGRMRGYYDSTDPESMHELLAGIGQVLKEKWN